MLEALITAFETLEDPRCEWKVEHRLRDILVIAVCAVLGEAESFGCGALHPDAARPGAGHRRAPASPADQPGRPHRQGPDRRPADRAQRRLPRREGRPL